MYFEQHVDQHRIKLMSENTSRWNGGISEPSYLCKRYDCCYESASHPVTKSKKKPFKFISVLKSDMTQKLWIVRCCLKKYQIRCLLRLELKCLQAFQVNCPSKAAKHYIVFVISQTKLQEYIRIKTKHGYQVRCFVISMSVIWGGKKSIYKYYYISFFKNNVFFNCVQ